MMQEIKRRQAVVSLLEAIASIRSESKPAPNCRHGFLCEAAFVGGVLHEYRP
jgi:hypothetical protein